MKQYLGIDIGGTNIKIGTVSSRGDVIARGLIETRPDEGAASAFIRAHAAAQLLAGGKGVHAVGIGCAGLVDEKAGVLRSSPNLPAWAGTNLAKLARKHFSVPVTVQNDATAGAYGESIARGARGKNLVFITLGTGVGGGVVADGRIVKGVRGFAGEIGHIVVDPVGPRCRCGKRGCLEAYAGSYAIKRTARRLARGREGPERLTAYRVFEAARKRKRWARETVRITGEHLGFAIASLLNTLNPSVVVIGGGVARDFNALLPHVKRAIARHAFRETMAAARIEPARLGTDAGMIGAAMLARDAARS